MTTSVPMRCLRCQGSGDIPIIQPDCFVHPERRPLLQCCPDCGGTGYAPKDETPEPERRKHKR